MHVYISSSKIENLSISVLLIPSINLYLGLKFFPLWKFLHIVFGVLPLAYSSWLQ